MPTLEGKSVVVTGGAGFIGSHLIDAIVEKKPARVVAIDNFFLGNKDNLASAARRFPSLEIVNLDATDRDGLKNLLGDRRIDVVFDLATIPLPASLEKPYWSSKVICDLALNLCELCREGMFQTLIHCSSSEAYGSAQYVPMDEEHPLKAIGRPFNNFGPRQNGRDFSGIVPRLIQRILKGETPVIFGDGKQTRDYLYSTDTALGLIALYESDDSRGQTFNLASGEETSVLQIVEDVSRLMGWKQHPRFDPPRPADVRRHCAATHKAEKIINFRPRVSWEAGIEETVRWYQENPNRLL